MAVFQRDVIIVFVIVRLESMYIVRSAMAWGNRFTLHPINPLFLTISKGNGIVSLPGVIIISSYSSPFLYSFSSPSNNPIDRLNDASPLLSFVPGLRTSSLHLARIPRSTVQEQSIGVIRMARPASSPVRGARSTRHSWFPEGHTTQSNPM